MSDKLAAIPDKERRFQVEDAAGTLFNQRRTTLRKFIRTAHRRAETGRIRESVLRLVKKTA